MKLKLGKLPVVLVTLLAALAAGLLRAAQLQTAVDAEGKFFADAIDGPLTWFVAVILVSFALYAFFMKKSSEMQAGKSPIALLLTLAAAALMAVGSAAAWQSSRLTCAGGLLCALCWVVIALQRQQGTKVSALWFMIPALYIAVELIVDFRLWSQDPQFLDYCFRLFAMIALMCATFHLGGFCFGKGKRRVTAFFCFAGILFTPTAAIGRGLVDLLTIAAGGLWLLGNLWLLLDEQ